MFDLDAIQAALQRFRLDGWLLYDFRASNVLARRVLDLENQTGHVPALLLRDPGPRQTSQARPPDRIGSARPPARRARGLPPLARPGRRPGTARPRMGQGGDGIRAGDHQPVYLAGRRRHRRGPSRLRDGCRLLRQPDPGIRGDLGTTSSGRCTRRPSAARPPPSTWPGGLIAERCGSGGTITEMAVQSAIMSHFRAKGLTTYSPPIVAVGPHSGDPHYEPSSRKMTRRSSRGISSSLICGRRSIGPDRSTAT